MVYHTKNKEPEGSLLCISIEHIIIDNKPARACAPDKFDRFVDVVAFGSHCRLALLGLCFHGNFV